MKVKLSIGERLIVPGVLPQKGSFEDILVKDDFVKKIRFTQEELEKYEIKQDGQGLKWNDPKVRFEYELTELEEALIKKQLTEMSNKKELGQEHISLYKKLVSKTETEYAEVDEPKEEKKAKKDA